MYVLVSSSRWFGGWRTLSWRSIQKNVWSEKSFLMIVLSQSNIASGRPPGRPEQVPRASMTVWMRWAFGPYHGSLSWDRRRTALRRTLRWRGMPR